MVAAMSSNFGLIRFTLSDTVRFLDFRVLVWNFRFTPTFRGFCRGHVVGQRVVSDISVVRWSLCSEYDNPTNLLLRLLIALLGTSILLHIHHTLTWPTTWRHVHVQCTWWPYIQGGPKNPDCFWQFITPVHV